VASFRPTRYQPVPGRRGRLIRRHPRRYRHFWLYIGDGARRMDALPLTPDEWDQILEAIEETEFLESHGVQADTGDAIAARFGREMEEQIHTAVALSGPCWMMGRYGWLTLRQQGWD
jgi:hypothetical protein